MRVMDVLLASASFPSHDCAVLDIRHEVPITQVVVEDESTEEMAPHESQPVGSFFDETRKPTASTSVAERKKISKDQLRAYEQVRQEQTLATFEKLDRTEEDMLAGNANAIHAWLSDCSDLVEEFRITRQLFTADRVRPLSRTGLSLISSIDVSLPGHYH